MFNSDGIEIRIIRSHNRVKTVSAREVDGIFEVRAPARMSDSELEPVVKNLLARSATPDGRGLAGGCGPGAARSRAEP